MSTPPMNRRWRSWRRFVGGLSAASLLLQAGCYSFRPLQTSVPATGSRIAVVLNDRGRFALGDQLGASVDKLEGLLVAGDSLNLSLDVYRTTDLRGGIASWTGERVQVPKNAITGYQERQFSRRRTALLVGTTVGVIAATLIAVRFDIFRGFLREGPGGETPPSDSR